MPYKVLATSDLHLGKISSGVKAGLDETATKHTWMQMIDRGISEDIDAVILAGDIIDRDDHYYEAIGQLQSGFKRLKNSGIEVFMVAGNHDFDVTTDIMKDGRFDNVTLLGSNGKWEVLSREKEGLRIQFAGWSFPVQHYREDPAKDFLKTKVDPMHPTIGILHCDVGNKESQYGPVDLVNLTRLPVDAWILGHIHKPQTLSTDPLIIYPGSPHALSSKEQGIHGPVIINISSAKDISTFILPLSPIRYGSLDIDITGALEEPEVRSLITSSLMNKTGELIHELERVSHMVWDINLTGSHKKIREVEAWVARVTGPVLGEEEGTQIQVRKVHYDLKPEVSNLNDLARHPSPAGRLAETILAIEEGRKTDFLDQMTIKWRKMAQNMSSSQTYQPLQNSSHELWVKNDQEATKFILKECNRLLSELIIQQEK